MPKLANKPGLKDFQDYVAELEIERGFDKESVLEKCLLLGEEIGELFKSIRKANKMKIDNKSSVGDVSEELADILIYLCAIANRFDIDLESAFREKENVNKQRIWE